MDYSLLFVSRFRDELNDGEPFDDAVATSLKTAGRTVAFAGGILVLAGLIVIVVSFGWAIDDDRHDRRDRGRRLLGARRLHAAAGLPAGRRREHQPLADRPHQPTPLGWCRSSTASSTGRWLASVLALIPLLLLCGSALRLQTGGPDLKMFKADNPMRQDMQAVADRYGGGVMAPYVVLVTSPEQPVTSPADIRALRDFQTDRRRAIPSVNYVIGLGTNRARRVTDATKTRRASLAKLDVGLGAASSGAARRSKGLQAQQRARARSPPPTTGARRRAAAGQRHPAQAQAGARTLNSGLGKSASGSRQLDSALAKLKQRHARAAQRHAPGRRSRRRIPQRHEPARTIVDEHLELDQRGSRRRGAGQGRDRPGDRRDRLAAVGGAERAERAERAQPAELGAQQRRVGRAAEYQRRRSATIARSRARSISVETRGRPRVDGVNNLDNGATSSTAACDSIASSARKLSDGHRRSSTAGSISSPGNEPAARRRAQQLANGLGSLSAGSDELAAGLNRARRSRRS